MSAPAEAAAPSPLEPDAQPPLAGTVPLGTLVPRDLPTPLGVKVARALVIALLAAVAGVVAYLLRFLLLPIALAFLMFYVLNPLVNLMENRRVPRGLAVTVCFLAMIGLIFGVGAILWPSLNAWLQQTPQPGEKSVFEIQLAARLAQWEAWGSATYPQIDWKSVFDSVRGVLESQRKQLMEGLPSLLIGIASSAGTFLLAPIIGLFILLDGAAMQRVIVAQIPNRYFETALLLIHRVDRQIAFYLRGAASESGTVALLLSFILWLAGMPNAVLFAVIYGALNVIPIVGPLLGASAGLLYALMDPSAPGLGVLAACYGGVYALDAMLINPLVVGKNLNLHPLTIIVGISVGGGLGGILGMLVSIPTIAIGKAIFGTLFDAYRRHLQHRLAA